MSSGNKSLISKIPAREWRGLVPEMMGGRLRVGMTCHQCGTEDHWTAAQMVGPQTAIPKVIHMGWSVDRKLTCPACLASKTRKSAEVIQMTPKKQEATVSSITDVLGASKKNKRLVILALEDYFDEAQRRYRDGHNDKSVAEELDVSEGFVKTVREEFYGQIAEPEEIADLRRQIAELQKGVEDAQRNLTAMCTRNGWKV